MSFLKILLLLFVVNLNATLSKGDRDISEILLNEAKNFAGTQRGIDMVYGSLDFNLSNSDALYELSLRNDIPLLDRIYLLKSAMDINKFESVKIRDLYYQYFSLILRQNEDISKNREIIVLYDRLDNDLKNDRDLIYMRLEASNRLGDFDENFDRILAHSFAVYSDDFRFFKWFLKENKFFPSLFSKLKLREDSFFDSDNIDYICKNVALNEPNSVALFSLLKSRSKRVNGVQSIYLLKYKLLTPDEAYMFFTENPPKTIGEYKMFYDLLADPEIKKEFLSYYQNLSGMYFMDDKNSAAVFNNGVLVGFFSKIVDYSSKLNKEEEYFNKVYFKNKAPVYYENSLFGYKVTYSIYPYVSMIEFEYSDKKEIYTFALNSFKYEIFNNFIYNVDYVGINDFLMADILEIFLPSILNLNLKRISLLNFKENLIEKQILNKAEVIEVRNYGVGNLISIYRKVNGSRKFNYVEIYDRGVIKAKRVILDDSYDVYYDIN
ncbi:hypothetical protein DB313_04145 [Borrelia turcica IST7]|uniref:Uncharacterized protein n=1 Tax=Borrelia turcica IST7 TaxID=1104446 RepID=A0A386PM27_9SPIR|nr:hypothetical protein [Borrelia turcica]AYE36636.1 hypothetical protein DB313_04145 [Borrelia turcica IST7]